MRKICQLTGLSDSWHCDNMNRCDVNNTNFILNFQHQTFRASQCHEISLLLFYLDSQQVPWSVMISSQKLRFWKYLTDYERQQNPESLTPFMWWIPLAILRSSWALFQKNFVNVFKFIIGTHELIIVYTFVQILF